jgi:hypothetical protein
MAKSARASSENLFSVSGASEATGRSRRTVLKALANVRPDAIRSGLRLWSMKKVISAINNYTEAPLLTAGSVSGELQPLFDQLDAADAEMRRIGSLKGRRAYARETLLPLLHEVDAAMRADGRACGEQELLTQLRCDQHLRVFLVSGLGPQATGGCDWSPEQCWDAYNAGDDGEDEEEAA